MKTKLKANKKLGRPSKERNPEDAILSNGLLLRQWNRIKKDCGSQTATEKLRSIVDWYFTQMDSESVICETNQKLAIAESMDRKLREVRMNQNSK